MRKTLSFTSILIASLLFSLISVTHAAKPSDFGLKEGDLVSAIFSDDPDVYIINEQGYKRLFLNPEIFKFYSHLGGFANVKIVTPEIRDAFPTSGLFRDCENNDTKVYGIEVSGEDKGTLRWINESGDQVIKDDPNFFKKVFCINTKEFDWYPKKQELTSVKEVPQYSRITVPAIPAIPATPASPAHPFSPIASTSHPLVPTTTPRPASGSFTPTPIPITQSATPATPATPAQPASPTASVSHTSTPTPTPTFTITPTPTATITPTITPSPTASVSHTPTPTATPSPTPTLTPTPPPSLIVTITSITPYVPLALNEHFISSVTLQWNAVTNPTGYPTYYKAWRRLGSGDWLYWANTQQTSFPDLNLGRGVYYYHVNACYTTTGSPLVLATDNCGPDSNIMTVTIAGGGDASDTTPPGVPTGLTASIVNSDYPYISWTASTDNVGVAGYNIYRDGTYLMSMSGTTVMDGTVSRSTTASYTVAAYDAAGNISTQSSSVKVASAASGTNGKSSTFAAITRNLTVGLIGDDVKRLQALLVNEVGYSADLITGYFGNITRDAVKRLQEKYGIQPPSGYFGEITRKTLQAFILQ